MKTLNTIPFQDFISLLKMAAHENFASHQSAKVKSPRHFEEMKKHLVNYYENIEPKHSFTDSTGQVWDCIPVTQQPSLQKTGKALAVPKDLRTRKAKTASIKSKTLLVKQELKDIEGKLIKCPADHIPLRRITLDELTRFRTLSDFFQKAPGKRGRGKTPLQAIRDLEYVHKYAHAYEVTDNIGGHSFLSVWQPIISGDQVFSLCQHWYTAGPYDQIQTVEAGWQVFPQHYNNNSPCLFIYWTADGYHQTGSYNNEDHKFVQVNGAWALGAPLPAVSTLGGTIAEIEITWYLTDGNWWLYINGLASENAVGYYPATLYGSGPLKDYASDTDYGGEVVGSTSWPQMGNGVAASPGQQNAAYQRNIYRYNRDGSMANASLTPSQQSPNCYTIDVRQNSHWGEYFYYGGPGGNGCS